MDKAHLSRLMYLPEERLDNDIKTRNRDTAVLLKMRKHRTREKRTIRTRGKSLSKPSGFQDNQHKKQNVKHIAKIDSPALPKTESF